MILNEIFCPQCFNEELELKANLNIKFLLYSKKRFIRIKYLF